MTRRILAALVAAVIALAGSASAYDGADDLEWDASPTVVENHLYLKAESFVWKEFDDFGSKLLKESGPRFALGYSRRHDREGFTFRIGGELLYGKVDYEGFAYDFDPVTPDIPLKTETKYGGYRIEADVGKVLLSAGAVTVQPFLALGYEWWKRQIEETVVALGADEEWGSLYSRLGLRAEAGGGGRIRVFAEGGLKLPLDNSETAKLPGYGKVKLEPGEEPSFFAEAGIAVAALRVSAYYESWRFKASDPVVIDPAFGIAVFQPESNADAYGVKVGVGF